MSAIPDLLEMLSLHDSEARTQYDICRARLNALIDW